MNIVITGGSTFMPIDKVRGITNIFKGRTVCDIANEATYRNHNVHLIGNKQMFSRVSLDIPEEVTLSLRHYSTYDMLHEKLRDVITGDYFKPDVVIQSAAVSDYKVRRVLSSLENDSESVNNSGKISSDNKKLYLELEPTEKIIDKIRDPWGFKGVLVKFKLEVDMSDDELLKVANRSLEASDADIIVANCLEWAREKAYIIQKNHETGERILSIVERNGLAVSLMDSIGQVWSVR